MRLRLRSKLLLSAVTAAGLSLAAGCGKSPPATVEQPPPNPTEQPSADVGSPLYPAQKDPAIALGNPDGADPLVIANATVQFDEKQQVGAEVDGKIEMLATPFEWD